MASRRPQPILPVPVALPPPPPAPVPLTPSTSPTPLTGLAIAVSGVFPGSSHSSIEALAKRLGAIITKSVTRTTTHLITTRHDVNMASTKVTGAQVRKLPIVNLSWLRKTEETKMRQDEVPYLISPSGPAVTASSPVTTSSLSPPPSPSPPPSVPARPTGQKRTLSDADRPQKSSTTFTTPTWSKKRATDQEVAKAQNASPALVALQSAPAKEASQKLQSKKKKKPEVKKMATFPPVPAATTPPKKIPSVTVDAVGSYPGAKVHIADDGTIYDASLNQTNAMNNNNKFYRLQVLELAGGSFLTWARWGRVGDRGQSSPTPFGKDLAGAIREFEKKFKAKSGYKFPETGPVLYGKYVLVETVYDDDSEEGGQGDGSALKKEATPEPESKLPAPVQDLVRLIFNADYFQQAMQAMNYNANKLPLGKLGKNTITRGFNTLRDLAGVLNNNNPNTFDKLAWTTPYKGLISQAFATEYFSNTFYSLIPHDFGRQRPPLINNFERLKQEIKLLESLSDMKAAEDILTAAKTRDGTHHLDRQFAGLNLQELTVLDHTSPEFKHLAEYLHGTRGATHHLTYEITDIFRIVRPHEATQFNSVPFRQSQSQSNRRLLWHGSRCTNFGGILSQGLRIAPPEAPVSGYMFGKGIYLADMSSKSANYCASTISGGHALLLLCEAELGPMQEMTQADYEAGNKAKARSMGSTWGRGSTAPLRWTGAGKVHEDLKEVLMPDMSEQPGPTLVPGAHLLYNEFIVYDVAQVKLRYLFRVRMNH